MQNEELNEFVDNLSKQLHLKESEFGHNHYDTYIYIRIEAQKSADSLRTSTLFMREF